MKTDRPLKFNEHVLPICLPEDTGGPIIGQKESLTYSGCYWFFLVSPKHDTRVSESYRVYPSVYEAMDSIFDR